MKKMIIALSLLMVTGALYAQATTDTTPSAADTAVNELPSIWTLDDCIRYAKEQNLTIQKSKISLESANVDLAQAKAAYWPTLSFASGQSVRYMPFAEGGSGLSTDGTTVQKQQNFVYSGNYGLNFSWTIWNGSRQKNIDKLKVESQISELQVAQTENEITESIMLAYMHVQYSAEGIKVNESTLETSKQLKDRAEAMKKVGSISAADYAQVASQYATDRYNLISSQANYKNYMLQLKQLLELTGDGDLTLAEETADETTILAPLPGKQDVYNAALANRPEIQAYQLSIESADLGIDKAKAGYMPSFGLSAGSSISHSSAGDATLAEQIKQGWNNQLGININVPIVDARQTKSAVEKAKLQKETAELNLLDQQKTLYKNIESLWLDAESSQLQYEAAQAKLESAQESYDLIVEQFKVGVKHATDLAQAKDTYLSALQEMLQCKYMAIYSQNMLKFYQGTL